MSVVGTFIGIVVTVTMTFDLQDPVSHDVNSGHVCPQDPQLDALVRRFTQVPLQQSGARDLQTLPQEPQFVRFEERFTQSPSQRVPPRTRHAFAVTTGPKVSVVSGVADEAVVVGTAVVTAAVVGAVVRVLAGSAGTAVQTAALQIIPEGHAFPHWPQFPALAKSS